MKTPKNTQNPKTPLFILETKKLEQNYKNLKESCENIFGKNRFHIAFSVKTNSEPEVLNILSKLGSNFEIASQKEIDLIKNKTKNKLVIFNGAAKTSEELKEAIKNNYLINTDSLSEINKISSIIKNKKVLEVGLRIAIEDSKFGIEENKIKEAIDYAESKNLKVICLHFHAGTQLSLKQYEEKLIIFSNILQRLNKKFQYIDIGGGIPDNQQLKNLNLHREDYLNIIKKHLAKFNSKIIIEPGRTIVGDSMYLLTKLISIKENFNKKYAILDAGINLLPKISLASYRFSKSNKEQKKAEKTEEYILAGPLLFSNDILGKFQGNLKEGDILKVENVGAYCLNLAWSLSYDKAKVILI
jgi:diaminopimelate decarboxylase